MKFVIMQLLLRMKNSSAEIGYNFSSEKYSSNSVSFDPEIVTLIILTILVPIALHNVHDKCLEICNKIRSEVYLIFMFYPALLSNKSFLSDFMPIYFDTLIDELVPF